MTTNKKGPAAPGIPLEELRTMLEAHSVTSTLDGNVLTVGHAQHTTRIEALAPGKIQSENGPIRSIVRITSELPEKLLAGFKGHEAEQLHTANANAALGALTSGEGKIFVGSRLTVYEQEDAWKALHLPLLCHMAIHGGEAILQSMEQTGKKKRAGHSEWTDGDLAMVERYMSNVGFCTTGEGGLTAELPIMSGPGHDDGAAGSALLMMNTDQPHPVLGPGLSLRLVMPKQFDDVAQLREACMKLNAMEMSDHDQPPHHGAWTVGLTPEMIAYRSFFPNAMHEVRGIAVNAAFWALGRAQKASGFLNAHS